MSSYVFLILSISTAIIFAKNCDKSAILIYEDLGCTSTSTDKNGCPNKFDCLGLRKKDQCYFRGKGYKDGEIVPDELSSPSCDKACFCTNFEKHPRFTCAVLDCPEWLGAPLNPGCYRKYSLSSCCFIGQACPPFENENVKCLVDGKEYREGERFYPKDSCRRCVCQKGFEGKFVEPFCKRNVCGAQLKYTEKVQDACAPVYKQYPDEEVLCCPKTWTCAEGNETIQGKIESENICNYGKQTLKVGQFFEKQIENVYGGGKVNIKCQCAIPPLLRCIEI